MMRALRVSTDQPYRTGQRLAAQKGQSDDIVGAMRAEERAGQAEDPASDEDED